MEPAEELRRSRLALWVMIQAVFNDAKVLDARDWNIRAGIGRYLGQPRVPFGIADTQRATRLGIIARYAIAYRDRPAAKADSEGNAVGFDFPEFVEDANRKTPDGRLVPLFLHRRRADLVLDDAAELVLCEFPYTDVASKLTPSVREKVYGLSLSQIKPPAGDSTGGGFFDTGSEFYATAAMQATYDLNDSEQPYYQKWTEKKPTTPAKRKYEFDNLTDDYLQLNYEAYELEKGGLHIFLALRDISFIAKLYFKNGKLTYDAILGERLPPAGDYFQILNNHIKQLKSKNEKATGVALFVHAMEGADHPPAFSKRTVDVSPNLNFHVMEQVVDPQVVVQSTRHLSFEQIDPIQKKWGRRDWLKEMVRLRFSEPWVWFWNNAEGLQMLYSIDREELFLKDLREAEQKATGPLKQTLHKFIASADADPNLYLVRRGSKYGEKRVIGSDETYVYFYDNKQKLVTRLPSYSFWMYANQAQISKVIYENTRGMIPISKAIVWAGVFVMGWAIVGTEMLVEGAKQYLKEKIEGLAMDKALKMLWDKFKLRLLVLVICPVLEFFRVVPMDDDPDDGSTGGSTGSKVYGFIKGFFEGFSAHALHSLLDRWVTLLNLEPASIRAIKFMYKIEAILRWIDEKMSGLKDYVSDQVAKLLVNRFISVVVKMGTGFICVVNNLYFLDYESAKPLLELFSELSGEKMPTKAEWDRLRHKQFLETFRHWEQAITEEALELDGIYEDVHRYVHRARWVVKGSMVAMGVHVLTGGHLVPMIVIGLRYIAKGTVSLAKGKAGQVAAGGFVALTILDDDFRKEVLEFLSDFADMMKGVPAHIDKGAEYLATPAAFAWGTKERMARFGQLLGIIIASLALSRALIKERKWTKRWAATKGQKYRHVRFVLKENLMAQLNINPLMPAIKLALFHYVHLIEKVIAESTQSFVDLEDRIEKILLGDTEFRDIIDPDEGLTLPKLIQIIVEVDKLLVEWLKKLAKIPGLTDQISSLAAILGSVAPDKMPTLDDLREGKLSQAEWATEAFMFVILSHLHGGLNWVSEALQSLLTPVNPKDPNPVSVGFVLQTLGLNLEEDEAMEVLDRNFEDVFKEEPA